MKVQEHCVVRLRYCIQNSKGEILENMMNGPGIVYLHGEGKILPGLEMQLIGLDVGETKHIQLKGADYLGLNDDLELEVIIDDVRIATTEELTNGINQSADESVCGDDCACYGPINH